MKKKWYIAGALLLLGLALAICVVLSGKMGTDQEPDTGPAAGDTAAAGTKEPVTEEYRSSMTEDKTETVYAKADPEGNVYEITVEAMLKNPGGSEPVPDRSDLTDIKNTKGEEEYVRTGDGTLLWDNCGEDISYKGTSNGALPVSVKISYYLDDLPMSPEEIAGKSGKVRIRFDYENLTSDTVQAGGREETVPVPFAVCSALFLPSDVFCNIEVTNGKVISMEDQNMVIGYAFPGLQDALALTDYEPTEDVEIPDYVELTANVSEFELEFTATVMSPGLFEDMDTEDLDDIEEMIDDMDELTDASAELVDGTSELLDGVIELKDGIIEYTDGVEAVDEGIQAVKDGLDMLDDQKAPLREGALALQNGLESLNTALSRITLPGASGADTPEEGTESGSPAADPDAAMQALAADLESLSGSLTALQKSLTEEDVEALAELEKMTDAVADIQVQLAGLKSYSDGLTDSLSGLTGLESVLGTLKDGVGQLAEGSKQLSEGVQAYTKGVSQLYRGSVELSDGSAALTEASAELNDGLTELTDGVQELTDGVREFDEEGIQSLADLAGDELETIVRRMRAIKEADSRYQNFSGLQEGQTGSVKFILETDEISF